MKEVKCNKNMVLLGDNYEIGISEQKKIIHMKVYGFFSLETASECVKDYKKVIAEIDTKGYMFFANASKLSIIKPEIIELFKKDFKGIRDGAFNNRIIINPVSTFVKMQVKAVIDALNYQGIVLDSLKDAQYMMDGITPELVNINQPI